MEELIEKLENDLKNVSNNYDYYATSVTLGDVKNLEERSIQRLIEVIKFLKEN